MTPRARGYARSPPMPAAPPPHDPRPRRAVRVAIACAVALGLVLVGGGRALADGRVADEAELRAWIAPTAEDPGELRPSTLVVADGRGELGFVVGDARCGLALFPIAEGRFGDMSAFDVGMRRIGPETGPCGEEVSRAIRRVQAHHTVSRDDGGSRPDGGPDPRARERPEAPRLLLLLGAILLAALVPAIARALGSTSRGERRLLLGATALAFAVRAIAPHRLVMVFFGYQHVGEAVDLAHLPRYGPGATLLWWALFRVAPPDHRAVEWLASVLGAITIGLWAVWADRVTARVAPAPAPAARLGAGHVVALVLALSPIVVRDHASESMAVPALLAFAAAALLATELVPALAGPAAPEGEGPPPVARRRVVSGLIALSALVLYAASCRPDLLIVIGPMLLATLLAAFPPDAVRRAAARAWPAIAAMALLAAPLAHYARENTRHDVAMGNLPRLATYWRTLPRNLLHEDVLFQPGAFPVALWLLVIAAIARPATRRAAIALVAGALVAIAPTFVDYNETSNLRLQMPGVTLFVLAVGFGWAALVARGGLARRAAPWLLALGGLSAFPSIEPLFRRRNPDVEDDLLRDARDAIEADRRDPSAGATVLLPGPGDLVVRGVHGHYPEYLFASRGIRPRAIVEESFHPSPEGTPRYFVRGVRCYGWSTDDARSGENPACAAVCERLYRGDPVFERVEPNLHDWPTFDGYGPIASMRLGLYRLRPR